MKFETATKISRNKQDQEQLPRGERRPSYVGSTIFLGLFLVLWLGIIIAVSYSFFA